MTSEAQKAASRRYQQNKRAEFKLLGLTAQGTEFKKKPPKVNPKVATNRRHALRRKLVFDHYGNGTCCRCGETDEMVLTIDHIDQNGKDHKPGNRKRRISGYTLYSWLVRNNFPAGYRVACANCQIRFYREK